MVLAQQFDSGGCGGIAGHNHGFDLVMLAQVACDGVRARNDVVVIALAIGRMAAVRDIDEALVWHLGTQRAQHAQAPQAAIEYPDGVGRGY